MADDNEVLESEWSEVSPATRRFFLVAGGLGAYDSLQNYDAWVAALPRPLEKAAIEARAVSKEKLREKAEAEREAIQGVIARAAGKRKPTSVDELHKQIMKGVKK